MALDFPTSPVVDQVYTYGGKSWVWTGTFWNAANQGAQGIQGIQGVQGQQGIQGTTGIQGTLGTQGAQGTQGQQGIQGTTGIQGTQGIQGSIGTQGAQGTQGIQGAQGIQGQQGIQGSIGAQGTQGITGSQGTQGITGSQGTSGTQGINGSQGIQGIQGITGSQGTQGTQGIQGAIGAGLQGIQGIQGMQGIQGRQGIQGISGTKVTASDTPPGTPSGTEFWWDSANGVLMVYYDDGNSQQWVSAMSGITGVQGTQGITGSAGPSTSINATNDTSSTTLYPVMVGAAGSNQTPKTTTGSLYWNASTGKLTVSSTIGATASPNYFDALSLYNQSDGGARIVATNSIGTYSAIELGILSSGAGTDDGVIRFSTATNGTLATRVVIDNVGSVGIGTTSPSVGLEYQSNTPTNTADKMILQGGYVSGGGGLDYGFYQAYTLKHSGSGAIWTAARIKAVESPGYGGQLIFEVNPAPGTPGTSTTAAMRIAANGSIGVNTASPSYKLDVNGTLRAVTSAYTPIVYDADNSGWYWDGASTSVMNQVQIASLGVGTAASGTTGEIRATNNITAYYTSDERLKTNIVPIADALKKLSSVDGVTYDWNETYKKIYGEVDGYFVRDNNLGVLAQQIEKVFPSVVADRKDGFKAVRYEMLVPVLIEAIKELSGRVKALEDRLNT